MRGAFLLERNPASHPNWRSRSWASPQVACSALRLRVFVSHASVARLLPQRSVVPRAFSKKGARDGIVQRPTGLDRSFEHAACDDCGALRACEQRDRTRSFTVRASSRASGTGNNPAVTRLGKQPAGKHRLDRPRCDPRFGCWHRQHSAGF